MCFKCNCCHELIYDYIDFGLKVARIDPKHELKLKAKHPRLKCSQVRLNIVVREQGTYLVLAPAQHLLMNSIQRWIFPTMNLCHS